MEEAGGQVLFRRMPHPGMDLLDHATRIGVRLKSSNSLKPGPRPAVPSLSGRSSHAASHGPASRTTSRTPLSSRARTSPPRVLPPNTPPVQYIHNIVVPLNAPTDELNISNTTNSQAFNGTRVRSTPLSAQRSKRPSLVTANTRVTASRCHTSASLLSDLQDNSTMQSDTASDQDPDHWNRSEQGRRYANEQDQVSLGRTRKRTSEACSTAGFSPSDDPNEIQPHRVDRMYYMSGSILPLRSKYNVDDSELNQLKEMAKARRQAKHYGRGLRKSRQDHLSNLTSDGVPESPLRLENSSSPFTPVTDPGSVGHDPDMVASTQAPPNTDVANLSDCPPSVSASNLQDPFSPPQPYPDSQAPAPSLSPYYAQDKFIQKQGFYPKLKLKTRLQLPTLTMARMSITPPPWTSVLSASGHQNRGIPRIVVQYPGEHSNKESKEGIRNGQFTPYRYKRLPVRKAPTEIHCCGLASRETVMKISAPLVSKACPLCALEDLVNNFDENERELQG